MHKDEVAALLTSRLLMGGLSFTAPRIGELNYQIPGATLILCEQASGVLMLVEHYMSCDKPIILYASLSSPASRSLSSLSSASSRFLEKSVSH